MSFRQLVVRVILFPWGLFRLVTWPTRKWRPVKEGPATSRFGWAILDLALILVVIVPASIVVLMELLIAANSGVGGESSDYRVPSDFDLGIERLPTLPGIPQPHPATADLDAFEDLRGRKELALRYAPVILLETGYRPAWDLPVAIDFDGNWDPRDNPDAMADLDAVPAVVYGELTAVTSDALYLTYSLYRVRDYDHPVRQLIGQGTHHDSDNEGFHVRVNRSTGEVESVETWFHNRFLVCNLTGNSRGTEAIRGRLHLEGTRPVIFSQSLGHGVRCAQATDLARIGELKVLRPSADGIADAPRQDRSHEPNLRYRLDGFEQWYAQAGRPDVAPLFAESIRVAPDLVVGHYIAAFDRENVGLWARPKPMWAWDDYWDGIPVAVWHFLPSVSFESHEGLDLSHDYLFNAPAMAMFGLSGNELRDRINPEDPGTFDVLERDEGRPGSLLQWTARAVLRPYVTRVFMALG